MPKREGIILVDYKDLLSMVQYAGMSYTKSQPHIKGEHLHSYSDQKTDIQYYIRFIDDSLVISFRGTDSLKDFFADIKFFKKKIPYGNTSSKIRVHGGFLGRYKTKEVRETILSYVTDDIKKVIILGHSYGAALATLCSVDIQYHHPKKDIEVVLFGAPRVGNKAFCKSYDKRLFKVLRVENGNDLVTKVPFKWMGFRHVGCPIEVGKKKRLYKFNWKDHHATNYLGSIFKELGSITVCKSSSC